MPWVQILIHDMRMPDDPQGEGLKAIKRALERIENANPMEKKLIQAMHVF